jgi:hypothetical protein
MSELPSQVTSPTEVQQPLAPATSDAAAEVPDFTSWELVSSSTPGPAQKTAPSAGKPPEKHDMEEILNNPMLLGIIGALVIFLVLGLAQGLLMPGGLSSPFGGNSVNASSPTLITPGITPSLTLINTAVPQTTSNSVASTSPAAPTTGGTTATTEPTMDTSSNYVVAAAPASNGEGPVYYPVTATQTIVTTAPTIPAEILAQLQNTATSATAPTGQVIVTTVPIGAGHPTGSTSWAGSGNYASDLFDLPAGVAKLSVTAGQGSAMAVVKNSAGHLIGSTLATNPAGVGSNSITIPAAGKYLVDINSYSGTWTATINMVSIKTPTTMQTVQTVVTKPPVTIRTPSPQRTTASPVTTRPVTTVPQVTTHTMVPQVPTQAVTTVPQPIIPVTAQTTFPVPVPF